METIGRESAKEGTVRTIPIAEGTYEQLQPESKTLRSKPRLHLQTEQNVLGALVCEHGSIQVPMP